MSENDSETEEWAGRNRMHYLNMALISFGLAAVMLDLNMARPYALIGVISMLAYMADLLAEQYYSKD